jgi:hypothetical protein
LSRKSITVFPDGVEGVGFTTLQPAAVVERIEVLAARTAKADTPTRVPRGR